MRRIFNYTSVELHTMSVITRSVWNACIYHYNIIQCSRVWTKSSSDCSATNFLFQPCLTYIWTLFSISSLNMHPMWTLKADVVQWLACNKKCGCILMQSLPRENCYIKLYKGAKVYPVLHISLKASRLVNVLLQTTLRQGIIALSYSINLWDLKCLFHTFSRNY